jgi:hypothetical protein
MVKQNPDFDRHEAGHDSDDRHRSGRHHHSRRRGRKERVLHTRISESLADDIRRIAEDLRVPASNLVRNVLEEVFDVVESVSDDVGELFEEVLDEAEAARQRIVQARSRSDRRRRERSSGDLRQARDRHAWQAARAEVAAAERAAEARDEPPLPPLEWHIVEAGRVVGPLRREELAAALRAGRLGRETLAWSAGMPDWQPAGQLAALAGLFEPPRVPGDASPDEGAAPEPAEA